MGNSVYHTIGVMSGTSLDGLDLAYCSFNFSGNKWKYEIINAGTIEYDEVLRKKLSQIHLAGAEEFSLFNVEYGRWIGSRINEFAAENSIKKIDLIASHGHTVFHQPERGLSLQIGSGNAIAAVTGTDVIYDFRSLDVSLGGQGAPLVPVGDELLFSDYTFCLNLGGFANISFKEKDKRIAFDICPANILLNFIADKAGKKYDNRGEMAASGKVIEPLYSKLNELSYYLLPHPKSLGREWLEKELLPLIDTGKYSIEDLLRTCCEHIAVQITAVLNLNHIANSSVLITGGGAFNSFLINRIKLSTKTELMLPDPIVINYKEALIFAFLGVLRMEKKINVWSGITGASADSCSGVMVLANDIKRN
jgi:anhydro-N-acetylmuramic acid kinase